MRPLSLTIVRLVCAFHDTTTLYFESESLIINNAFFFVNETQEFTGKFVFFNAETAEEAGDL
jgi:hypothetical protein